MPKASTVAVSFSGGGSGPLLSGVKDGRTLTLSWPKPLPAPALAENVATYPDVLPGVDLQLKSEVEGFSQLLIVKTAQAAANPELASLKYKLDTVGLTVSTDAETGSVRAVNPAGENVFTSPSPLMWDSSAISSGTAARAGTAAADADDNFEPAPGAQDAQMPTTVSGDTLEIKPDQQLLTGAATKFPVYIDPSWAWGKRQNWTRVYKHYPNTSYWNTKEVVRVGYEAETGGSARISRSFVQLDTANLKGAAVKSSTFRIRNTWSWSCQDRPVEMWHVGPISSKTTWNRQPAKLSKLFTVDDAKGWSKDCAAGNLEFDATTKIREAASKRWSSVTFGLYASNETDTFGWKKFDAKTAVLETVYNNPPKTPSSLGTFPKTSCASGGQLGNTRVSVYAKLDDRDGGNLSAEFQIFKSGNATPVAKQILPASKGKITTYAVPDSYLTGGDYTWKVRAKDQDNAYSSWSPTCKFSIDRARPSKPPIITSDGDTFPPGDNGWPSQGTGKARTTGMFSFAPNGADGVVEYGYYTDHDPDVRSVLPGTPVPITPPGYGPHFLYAFSVDQAGNRSDTATYIYYAARSLERDGPHDLNGDSYRDIWSVDSNGTLMTYAGQGDATFSAATNGGGTSFEDQQIASVGDWGQDGANDLVTLQYDTVDKRKKLWTYRNNGTGVIADEYTELTVTCPVKDPEMGCDYGDEWTGDDHWSNAEQVIGPGDINGDKQPDLLVKQGKQLWAYYGNRAGYDLDVAGTQPPTLVGAGDWDKFTVIAPGDVNGDNLLDLWLRENSTGTIWRSYGKKGPNGVLDPTTWGNSSGRVKIGTGYTTAAYPALGSVGDVTGDGLADLWARKTDNTMLGWPGKTPAADNSSFGASFVIDGITGGTRIPSGTTLTGGQSYTSRSAKLTMGTDGNLVVTSNADKVLWSTKTQGNPGAKAVMQADGNLVINAADGSTKLWESQTAAPNGHALLQDRGNLVVYNVKGQAQWSSGTAIRHDYNGDGRSDMGLWYDFTAGTDATYTVMSNSDGSFQLPYKSFAAPAGAWEAKSMKFVTGDFNGDGRGDMAALYGYSDTSIKLWTALGKADGGFGTPFASWSVPKGVMHTSYMTPQSGDFNGDGRDDVAVWYAYPDGTSKIFTYTATVSGGFNKPVDSWTAPSGTWLRNRCKFVTGDFNGDGRDDLGVFYGQGDNTVRNHTFLATVTGGFTNPTSWWYSASLDWNRSTPHAGDFNGDGRDDAMIWYDYADGSDKVSTFIAESEPDDQFGSAFVSLSSSAGNWDIKRSQLVIGDYNGDGRDDIGAMYHQPDGAVRMWTWTAREDAKFNGALASWIYTSDQWVYGSTRFFKTYN
ncbi:FG-GAP-like repeat-containing protein [Streptomyces sp. NBC_00467]|uniref:FG-GAP-like repeat-containing protein n=1 Tax=Streptomyces sp. NBC_00467 TaxID=2975752 RepID=UPI002E17C023